MPSKALISRKQRMVLAIILMPLAPVAVFFVADLGRRAGENVSEAALQYMADHPFLVVLVAVAPAAVLLVVIIRLIFGTNQRTGLRRLENEPDKH